jgi:seryl-tRNA synthetase
LITAFVMVSFGVPAPAAPKAAAAPAAKAAAAKAAAAKAAASQTQAQIQKLTEERDDLKDRLAATGSLQEDLAAAQKSRDMARQETDSVRKELEQMKSALAENQGSADSILKEMQKAKEDLAAAQAANEALRAAVAEAREKQAAPTGEGTLVPITPDIIPARPINLNRVTPRANKVGRGVVVVNVLVSENGEVLDSRLLQGLPGKGEWVDKANAACVDQAKRLVFDPARAADGKTRLRVWQGVGFFLD